MTDREHGQREPWEWSPETRARMVRWARDLANWYDRTMHVPRAARALRHLADRWERAGREGAA